MDSQNLDELHHHFSEKVEGIKKCMQMHDCVTKDNCRELLQCIHIQLIGTEDVITHMKTSITNERQKLVEIQELINEYKEFFENIQYMSKHLPNRLPGRQATTSEKASTKEKVVLQSRHTENKAENDRSVSSKPSKQSARIHYPKMEYLTMDEFEDTPKYMKGRLSYDIMNNVVDGINKVIEYKYKLKAQPRNTVGENDMKKRKQWKQQENKETKGLHFFTDEDYRKYSSLKLDKATNSIFTILRHLGRLTEVRGGGCTRYCLSPY